MELSDFRNAFDHATAAQALVDLNGRFLKVNRALCRLLGYTEFEFAALELPAIIHPQDIEKNSGILGYFAADPARSIELRRRFVHKSCREIHGRLSLAVAVEASGKPAYFIAHFQDETERHHAELLENDRRRALEMIAQDKPLRSVLHQLIQLIERQIPGLWVCIMLLHEGTMRPFPPTLPDRLADAIKRRPVTFAAELAARTDEMSTAPRIADVETDAAWEWLREDARAVGVKCCWAVPVTASDGVALGLLVLFSPERRAPSSAECSVIENTARLVTVGVEHHQTTRQLAYLVRHDPLTGLPNRIMFEDRLQQALTIARRSNKPLALLALDLNRFKQVNDTLGHHAGDLLLQQFAGRVRSRLRASDTLARVGGDEFMLILPEVSGRDDAEIVARRVMQGLASAQFELAGHALAVTSSIGVALFPADGDDTMLLQRAADAAMYRAKEQSRRGETTQARSA